MMKRVVIAGFLVIAGLALLEGTALAQCSMCRTALESSAEGQAITSAFRKGILLLLAAPYAIVGTIGYKVFKAHRQSSVRSSEMRDQPAGIKDGTGRPSA